MEAVVACGLDGTLYREVDFVHSAFAAIAGELECCGCDRNEVYETMRTAFDEGDNPINAVIEKFNQPFTEKELVEIYRTHKPEISLSAGVPEMLSVLKSSGCDLALITDGRLITQNNKIEALGLADYFPKRAVVISETTGCDKTAPDNFIMVQNTYGNAGIFFYVGDNPAKDFLQPNRLGWNTICLKDDGRNIHPQDIAADKEALPHYTVKNVSDITQLIINLIKHN